MTEVEPRTLTVEEAVTMAGQLYNDKKDKSASDLLRSVLLINKDNFDANNLLGAIAARNKNYYEAFYRFTRACMIDNKSAQALSNLGMVNCEFENLDEAVALFKMSLDIDPDCSAVVSNLATIFNRMTRDDEAIELFNRVMEMDPGHETTFYNRGVCLLRLGRLEEALLSLDEAVKRMPDDSESRYNRGICKLSAGDLAGGFADYEYRTTSTKKGPYYMGPFEQPKWTGTEDLHGKRILVHAEQGMGDTIQFMRYLPMLKERGAHILFITHDPLQSLARTLGVEVLVKGMSMPQFDYWSPLVSLALAFGTTEETIPPPAPFSWDLNKFHDDVNAAGRRFKVGVCWSGNFQHKNDLHRSVDLTVFRSLLYMHNVAFFNLQKDIRQIDEDEFKTCSNLIDMTGRIRDMRDTAGLIHLSLIWPAQSGCQPGS
jgi:tetratricopeptide (TPR) repeat protein